jgi:hypothetical protein
MVFEQYKSIFEERFKYKTLMVTYFKYCKQTWVLQSILITGTKY